MSELQQAINEMRNMRESYDQLVSQNAQLVADMQELKDAHILEFNTGGVVWTHPETITPLKLLLYKNTITHLVDDSVEEMVNAPDVTMPNLEYLELSSLSLYRQESASGFFFSTGNIKAEIVKLPHLLTFTANGGGVGSFSNLRELYLDNLLSANIWQGLNSCPALRMIYVPNLRTTSSDVRANCLDGCPDVIDIVCGQNFNSNQYFTKWSPTNALNADSSSLIEEGEPFANNLEKLLYNIREHIAANLPTITAGYSITFSAAVKAAILADQPTADAFTNKGWTIA